MVYNLTAQTGRSDLKVKHKIRLFSRADAHRARKKAHKGTAFFWIVQIKYVKNVFYIFIVCVCAFFLLLLQAEYKLG